MTERRMEEFVLRYGLAPSYICRVPSIEEYMSTFGPLEIDICKKTFRVEFRIQVYPFMEELLLRCRLVPTQIHFNTRLAMYNFMIKYVEVRCEP